MELKNQDIRSAIANAGLKQWQIAEAYGLHESNFSRLLRKELNPEVKTKILNTIEELKREANQWNKVV